MSSKSKLPRYLVANLSQDVEGQLKRAFAILAERWLRNTVTRRPLPTSGDSWREFARAVNAADEDVSIEGHADIVDPGPWKRIEVFNGLRHIEVLLAAIERLHEGGPARLDWCAPTQGSADSARDEVAKGRGTRDRLADLEGTVAGVPFILEAYGGVNYRNNSKMAHDLDALYARKAHLESDRKPEVHCYVAVRGDSIASKTRAMKPTLGKAWAPRSRVEATCLARHGGPYRISARVESIEPRDYSDYHLIRVTPAERRPPLRKASKRTDK